MLDQVILTKQLYLKALLERKEALIEAIQLNGSIDKQRTLEKIEAKIIILVDLIDQYIDDKIRDQRYFLPRTTEVQELINYQESIKYYNPKKYILTANGDYKRNWNYISTFDHGNSLESKENLKPSQSLVLASDFLSATSYVEESTLLKKQSPSNEAILKANNSHLRG